jgi:hypothetical protein
LPASIVFFFVALLLAFFACAFATSVSVTADSTTATNSTDATAYTEFSPCKTCVFVLERIKKGTNMLLPAICSEVYMKYPQSYGTCHHVLNSLSLNGNNVRYWLFEGCYKYEIYGAREWIKPCPSHVMCSTLQDLAGQPFCKAMAMEDPFAP